MLTRIRNAQMVEQTVVMPSKVKLAIAKVLKDRVHQGLQGLRRGRVGLEIAVPDDGDRRSACRAVSRQDDIRA
jgi:ribosomal protein S8